MTKIAMVLMLVSAGYAQATEVPKNGHSFCIKFLNRNFSKNGLVYKADMLFTEDGRMSGTPKSDPDNETAHLQSKSEPPPPTPEAPSFKASRLDYRLFQSSDLKFKAFHLAHTVTDKTKKTQLENEKGRTIPEKVLKQLTMVNANVEFGWDEKQNACTVTRFSRTKWDINNRKEVVLVYPTVEQCIAFQAAPAHRKNALIKDYLVTTEQNGFESPFSTLAQFEKKPWGDVDKKTEYVPAPILNGCKSTYGELLASLPEASTSSSPSAGAK